MDVRRSVGWNWAAETVVSENIGGRPTKIESFLSCQSLFKLDVGIQKCQESFPDNAKAGDRER